MKQNTTSVKTIISPLRVLSLAYISRSAMALAITMMTLCTATLSRAATVPQGFTDSTFVFGIPNGTAMQFAPDGRLFVAQQTGALRVVKNGQLLNTPFLTVTVDAQGERGLLGFAFDPQFTSNGYIYIYYTTTTPTLHNRVSRVQADPNNPDVARRDNGTLIEDVLLDIDDLSGATNHNGGAMHFGPDGKLYIAVGDNATGSNAQTLANLKGKMLRLNADGTIPTDNPFYNQATGKNRAIWALGLRNPYTFSFNRNTGRMFINDVGQNTWEEINDGLAGTNYGWPTTEGPTTNTNFTGPVFAYQHGSSSTTGCAITGGDWYDSATATFPSSYNGKYFFADYCSGWIRVLDPSTGSAAAFATNIPSPVDLTVGPDGALYYLARGDSTVGRIQYNTPTGEAPVITSQPQSQTVAIGQAATFSVSGTGTMPFSFQWQRNGVNIPGATEATYTLPSASLTDSGAHFRVVVTNAFGTVTSSDATLTVVVNKAPRAKITSPKGARYTAGDLIQYAGNGTDKEDGALPASAFTWSVVFHHDMHTHPFIPQTSGARSGTFTIPTRGETATNVWYRIYLTVRDSNGATDTAYVDVKPRLVRLRIKTNPGGGQISLDGMPATGLISENTVAGMVREVGAVSPQTINGINYVFDSWSDGGAATHEIAPTKNLTLTANLRPATP
ncbi:MAG TPA: PQQ-dependent sugar dehydrogenase [Abditibacteriaceae bacterium]|jgi:glucose/arabinose dehydrogenase